MGVVWHSLELEGFGRYRGRVVAVFRDGINTIVGENETGKSTLVAGLSAVIFGLPNSSFPDAFGNRRFRNWDGPANFSGRVEFSVDGQHYRITRQFDGNRILLEKGQNGAGHPKAIWQALVHGEHNPGATKRNEAYEQKLAELVGVRSRELFERTFCVGQPLPDGTAVDGQVQELLAGAGGGLEGALSGLLERLRKVTRLNTDYGVGERNARLDGRLDLARRKVQEGEETLRSQGETLDRLHVEQAELAAAEERRRTTAESLREKESTSHAWAEWQGKRGTYDQAVRAKAALAQAQEKAKSRRWEIDELERRIRQDYAAFDGLPESAGERLAALATLEQRAAERSREMEALSAQLREDETRLQALEARLSGELAGVRGRPDLPGQLGSLRRLAGQLKELREALAAARAAEAEASAVLARVRPWGQLGGSPAQTVRSLRRRAAEIIPAWARLSGLLARAGDLEHQIQEDYGPFQDAGEETINVITRYEATLGRLQQEEAAAAAELAQLESAAARFRQEEKAIADEFADLEDLASDFGRAAQAKIGLLEEKHKLETAVAQQEAARGRRHAGAGTTGAAGPARGAVGGGRALLVALLVAVVGFAATLGLSGGLLGAGMSALVAVLAGAVAFLVALRWPAGGDRGAVGGVAGDSSPGSVSGATAGDVSGDAQAPSASLARLKEVQAQMEALAPALRAYADSGAAVLTEIVARLSRREARLEALHSQTSTIPGFERLGEVTAKFEQARATLNAFLQSVTLFREKYPDPSQAYRSWEALKHEHGRVRTQLEEIAASLGVAAEDPEGATLAGRPSFEGFSDLTAVSGAPAGAAASGARATTFGQLVDWLQSRPAGWWEEAVAEAQEYEAAAVRLRDAQNRLRDLTVSGADGRDAEERLSGELAALARQVAPYSVESDPETVQVLVQQAQTFEEERVRRGTSAAESRLRLEKLTTEHQQRAEEARTLGSGLAAPLAAAAGVASKALELWQAYLPLARRRAALNQELAGLLQGQGVADEEALARRLTDAEARMGVALQEWKALVAARPGLPPTDVTYDFEDLARRQVTLEQEINVLSNDLKVTEDQVDRLRREVYALKAKDLVNLAQLQETLARDTQTVKDQEMEAKALGMAYTELDAARRDYQAAYRGFLAERTTAHFAGLSGVADRQVLVDEDFHVSLRVPAGDCAVAQLSQGARDQLYLALRLAVADLLARDVQLPFVFDDPFLTCDAVRLERIRAALGRLAAERQIILLSHRPELAAWGEPVRRTGDGAVAAGGAQPA